MNPNKTPRERADRPLASSFERYLQDKGKGRGGEGGNYRRIAARELDRFVEWAAGERGDEDWTGISGPLSVSTPRLSVLAENGDSSR